VPGGLRLVIARALRTIDLPPFASLDEFCAALRRFAAEDLRAAARTLYGSWQGTHSPHELTISDLRRARRATGLSLHDISSACGVSVPLLRELEWGYMKNWRRDGEGRAQLARYARAAGLDEQLVLSIAWPMLEEAARDAELARAMEAEAEPRQPEIVDAIVLAQNVLPVPAVAARARQRFSVWGLVSAAAILLVAGLSLSFWHQRPELEAARAPEVVDTALPLADDRPAPLPAAMKLARPESAPHEPVVRAVQQTPSKAKTAKPAVKRAAAPKKPPSKPNFFKRTLLKIVLR
jgi:transcriptional regulator with XRE-family HTH domain